MTYRMRLQEHARDQYGFVTTRDAAALDVPAVELRKLAARGGLESVAYGIYRIPDAQRTNLDQYAEAVLRVGRDAHLTRDAVLAMHNLALVNPRRIKVGTPHRVRSGLPSFVQALHEVIPPEDLTEYEGIPSTTVARALLDSRDLVMGDRLRDGVKQALQQGLLTRRQASKVRNGLRRPQTREQM